MKKLEKKVRNKFKEVNRKGHERVTMMIIPHGEAHIFNLQLSKITMLFASFILFAVVIASFFSLSLQEDIQDEVSDLYVTNEAVYSQRDEYMRKLNRLIDKEADMRELIIQLYRTIQFDRKEDLLFTEGDVLFSNAKEQLSKESVQFIAHFRRLQEQKKSNALTDSETKSLTIMEAAGVGDTFQYHPEVIAYRQLKLDLNETRSAITGLESFITEREEVQNSLPYAWPLTNGQGHFTSMYGRRYNPTGAGAEFHYGVDLGIGRGKPVIATADAIVESAGYSGGLGNRVRLHHRFGFQTVYGHMQKILVHSGQHIKKGQVIGKVGSTGRSTGPHLHYEIYAQNGLKYHSINPIAYLRAL